MADEKKTKTYLIRSDENGEVRIWPDVVITIAALAALDIPEVANIGGNITREEITRHTSKHLEKYVRSELKKIDRGDPEFKDREDTIAIDIAMNLKYKTSIPKVIPMVQEKVKSAIENMTGISVQSVNVKILGVESEDNA